MRSHLENIQPSDRGCDLIYHFVGVMEIVKLGTSYELQSLLNIKHLLNLNETPAGVLFLLNLLSLGSQLLKPF